MNRMSLLVNIPQTVWRARSGAVFILYWILEVTTVYEPEVWMRTLFSRCNGAGELTETMTTWTRPVYDQDR